MTLARALLLTIGLAACDPKEKAQELADRAASGASTFQSDAKSAALSEVDKGLLAAKTKLFGLTDTGALSESGLMWLSSSKPAEAAQGTGIEAHVAKGSQIASVTLEAHRVLNQAVDEDTAIEPIYQKVEPGKEAEVDASIKAMPRVEVIDGFTVGFKKLDAIETTKIKKEQAVLVMWRKDDHLVGFLYRSHRTIDLEVVVRETPRLLKLMHQTVR